MRIADVARTRALTVANSLRDDPTVCEAWVESRGARCGRAGAEWLCKRHRAIAEHRLSAEVTKAKNEAARAARWREQNRPAALEKLARIDADLARLRGDRGPLDHGELNTPLRGRGLTDAQIDRTTALLKERAKYEWAERLIPDPKDT